jgi:hypothetical protein
MKKYILIIVLLIVALSIASQTNGVTQKKDKVIQISSGNDFTCALLSNGTVKCWGDNRYGQLGNGSNLFSSIPVTVVFSQGPTGLVTQNQNQQKNEQQNQQQQSTTSTVTLPIDIKPAIPLNKTITSQTLRSVLPTKKDYLLSLTNFKITRIATTNNQTIIFAVRDTDWKCSLYQNTKSTKAKSCSSIINNQLKTKEIVIKITNKTNLLLANRKKTTINNFQVNDKINIYGYLDKQKYSLEALTIRNLNRKQDINLKTPKNITSQSMIDCGVSSNFQKIDCFIDAAKTCSPAKIIDSYQFDFLGFSTYENSLFEIRGKENNKCLFYIKILNAKTQYSQQTIQQFLASGISMEEIKKQEAEALKMVKTGVGRDGICRVSDTKDIVSLFDKWKKGEFTAHDFDNFDCKGEVFGTGEQPANISKTITYDECKSKNGYLNKISDQKTACFKDEIDLGSVEDFDNFQCCVPKK